MPSVVKENKDLPIMYRERSQIIKTGCKISFGMLYSERSEAKEIYCMNKFYDLYMMDKVRIEDLDDFLEEWNRCSSDVKINEFLGLTEEQYQKWCDGPEKLKSELDFIRSTSHKD